MMDNLYYSPEYRSTNGGTKRIPGEIDHDIRKYLKSKGYTERSTKGELQDDLLAYRTPSGDRLMIHQLEPYMVEYSMYVH